MNMIEQVARAIYAAEGNQTKAPGEGWRPTRLDEEDAENQQLYFDYARAAIGAMREPTEAMDEAGRDANPRGPTVWPDYDAAAVFTAMIDAALEEGK